MNLYDLKRAVLTPYIRYMRRKEQHQAEPFIKAALELHYYRPAFYRFWGAASLNQNILHDVPIDSTSVVVDVGAHDGSWAEKLGSKYGSRLYLFEPDPSILPALRARFANHPRATLFEYGLNDRDATCALEQRGLGSTTFSEGMSGDYPRVEIRLRDVAAVLAELGHSEIDLMKINIEGGEYEVLERIVASRWLPKVRCFLIQYHEWRDGAYLRRWRIQRAMRRTHRLEWDYPFVWEKWVRR